MHRFLYIFFLFFGSKLTAQVSGKALVDSTRMLIGDQNRLRIELMVDKGVELLPIDRAVIAADSVFEILDESRWDTLAKTGERLQLLKNLLFIAWDSGLHRMPSLPIAYKLGERVDTLYMKDIPIEIGLPAVDTTLADIKPILEEPLKLQDYIGYIIGIVALVAFISLLLYLRKRKRMAPPPAPVPVVQLLPHELAIKQLEELAKQQLWQKGDVKGYHSALTHIVREYLEGRYGIQALEQTTDEILAQLLQGSERGGGFNMSLSQRLGDVLQTADLVKFAKAQPTAEFHERAMEVARAFILETKPVAIIAEATKP